MILTAALLLAGGSVIGYGGVMIKDAIRAFKAPIVRPPVLEWTPEKEMARIDAFELANHDEHAFWLHPNRWDDIDSRKDMIWERDLAPIKPKPQRIVSKPTMGKRKSNKENYEDIVYLKNMTVGEPTIYLKKKGTKTDRAHGSMPSPCGCYDMPSEKRKGDYVWCPRCGATWIPASRNIREIAQDAPNSFSFHDQRGSEYNERYMKQRRYGY